MYKETLKKTVCHSLVCAKLNQTYLLTCLLVVESSSVLSGTLSKTLGIVASGWTRMLSSLSAIAIGGGASGPPQGGPEYPYTCCRPCLVGETVPSINYSHRVEV